MCENAPFFSGEQKDETQRHIEKHAETQSDVRGKEKRLVSVYPSRNRTNIQHFKKVKMSKGKQLMQFGADGAEQTSLPVFLCVFLLWHQTRRVGPMPQTFPLCFSSSSLKRLGGRQGSSSSVSPEQPF